MLKVKKITIDMLKPTELRTSVLLELLEKARIKKVEITSYELERSTESLKVVVEGEAIDIEEILALIRKYGGVVQNLESIVAERA